jgi:hypothetical protein
VAAARPTPDSGSGRITIPRLNKDPVQSLCPFSVVVTVGHHDVEIPALPASEWLSVLMVESLNLDDIFPGLLNDEDADFVEEMILSGDLGLDEYEDIILTVIETASARSWWIAIRLIETARTSWDSIGAELGLRGVDATQVSLSLWLDMLMLTAIKSMEPKDVQMWCMKIEAPPPQEQIDESTMEISSSQFMAMAR